MTTQEQIEALQVRNNQFTPLSYRPLDVNDPDYEEWNRLNTIQELPTLGNRYALPVTFANVTDPQSTFQNSINQKYLIYGAIALLFVLVIAGGKNG